MKIGTITTHMADNYGAVLQAYALQSYIGKFAECEIINYYPTYVKKTYHQNLTSFSLKSFILYFFKLINSKKRNVRKDKFKKFRNQFLNLSQQYTSFEELKGCCNNYTSIIAGSDQIWNPNLHEFDESYFLTFCNNSVLKNGYAPSFGVSELTDSQKKEIKKRCYNFKCLGFREKSGVNIAKELLNMDCPLILDPVFLLSKKEWKRIISCKKSKEKYILCYFLSDPKKSIVNICKKFKNENINVYSIGFSIKDFFNNSKKIYDLGPLEFLEYIYNAEYIITDSFHATAFSIIFEKNFYTRIDGGNAKRADRIISLFDSVGINRGYCDQDSKNLRFDSINYSNVNEQLMKLIANSKNFVKKIIDDAYLLDVKKNAK